MIDIDFEHFETQVHVPQFPTFSMKSLHTKRPPVCCCFVGFFVVVGCFFVFVFGTYCSALLSILLIDNIFIKLFYLVLLLNKYLVDFFTF